MNFENIIITNGSDLVSKHKNEHPDYEYHYQSEEVFYIISGTGLLKTPEGEYLVKQGDILAFPAYEKGAHKLTNTSNTENLVYIDFDTYHTLDISFMPESNKKVIYGQGLHQVIQKFHKPGCSYLPTTNRRDTDMTRDEIISKGYDPCKKCNP